MKRGRKVRYRSDELAVIKLLLFAGGLGPDLSSRKR
jgi:hypothetical protein